METDLGLCEFPTADGSDIFDNDLSSTISTPQRLIPRTKQFRLTGEEKRRLRRFNDRWELRYFDAGSCQDQFWSKHGDAYAKSLSRLPDLLIETNYRLYCCGMLNINPTFTDPFSLRTDEQKVRNTWITFYRKWNDYMSHFYGHMEVNMLNAFG